MALLWMKVNVLTAAEKCGKTQRHEKDRSKLTAVSDQCWLFQYTYQCLHTYSNQPAACTHWPYWLWEGHAPHSGHRSGSDSNNRHGRNHPRTLFCDRCHMWETLPVPSELPETPRPASSPGPYTAQTADVTSCVEDRGAVFLISVC